jgi:hypothetical protein
MRIEEEIRDVLASNPTVAALATGGVYLLIVPQHETLPSVRVQLIDEPTRHHLRGRVNVLRARIQIDAFATETDVTPDPMDAIGDLSEAIDDALMPEPFDTINTPALRVLYVERVDRRHFEPDEFKAFRMMQDYQVTYRH